MLVDAEPATRNKFLNGLSALDRRSRSRYGADFIKATPEQQVALLAPASNPAVDIKPPAKAEKESAYVSTQPLQQDRAEAPPDPELEFFRSMKSMTITGFYTSEIGMKEEVGDDGAFFFDDYLGCDDPIYSNRWQAANKD